MPALEHIATGRGLDEPRLVHVSVFDFPEPAALAHVIVCEDLVKPLVYRHPCLLIANLIEWYSGCQRLPAMHLSNQDVWTAVSILCQGPERVHAFGVNGALCDFEEEGLAFFLVTQGLVWCGDRVARGLFDWCLLL